MCTGCKQREIERRFRTQRDYRGCRINPAPPVPAAAPINAPMAAPLPPTSDRPDSSSSAGATAHHDRRALAFSFAGCHCGRSLNFIILPVDSHSREPEAQRGAALEPAGSFRFIHDSLARAPLGMATFPSTSTGDSTVAENLSPGLLVFETYGLI